MQATRESISSYTNPVYDRYFADPFVFLHEGIYYAIGTGEVDHGVFLVLRSKDFAHWEPLGPAMVPDEPLGTDHWAPEVAYADGKFYMYFSAGFGDAGHRMRVAVSEQPEGPYVDAGIDLVDRSVHPFAIDASPFQDDDGQWYLFYARDFLDCDETCRPGTALVVDRLVTMTQLAGEERVVMRASSEWQRFMKDRPMYDGVYDWHTLEGPCVRKRNGRYYCFYSGGRWENETYGVDYAEASHPLGPWSAPTTEAPRVLRTVPGKVLGPGHNSMVVGPDGVTDYIVYHAWDVEMTARRMCIDRMEWTPEGPRCLGPTSTPQPL